MPDAEIQDEIWQNVDSGHLMGMADPVFREDAGFFIDWCSQRPSLELEKD